jgi:hypothetical protein
MKSIDPHLLPSPDWHDPIEEPTEDENAYYDQLDEDEAVARYEDEQYYNGGF